MVDSVSIRPAKTLQLRNVTPAESASVSPHKLMANAPLQASLPKLIQMASALARQDTPIDYAKISQVRHAIANGDYKIDPARIADAMLRFHSKKDG